ncbi:cyclin dependent kinase inhibitor 1Ca [Chanos chanos]|uniref:Cyclin-dependent kinase inhibitor 1C n=1 Tax=Chanos chanos TaxID=29144 RepID=A0A6J2X0Y2_CHACN|nr:cyclin-dependent kinase inhibitor 1C-like [Chanos chanos]
MSRLDIAGNLERHVVRRTFPFLTRTGACRNLFGPVDHDELKCELKSKLREISERDQTRWNFNFDKDSPLPGEYEWQEVSSSSTPVFYQDSIQNGRTRIVLPIPVTPHKNNSATSECGLQNALVSCIGEKDVVSSGSVLCHSSESNQENRSDTLNAGKTESLTPLFRRQKKTSAPVLSGSTSTQITDFFSKRKRTFESKNIERTSQHPTSPVPVEQTPRKRMR